MDIGVLKRVINVEPIVDPIPRRTGELDARSVVGLPRESSEPSEPLEPADRPEPASLAAEDEDS